MTEYLTNGKAGARPIVVLAHGAGAPMNSPSMEKVAEGIADGGLRVVRFEFPYMAARRAEGRRKGPDRPQVLMDTWREVVADLGEPSEIVIGGKSMGGRIATMVADELGVAGLICLGYPFHPPGKPEKTRTAHLEKLRTPALFLQGTRDALGNRDDVAGYSLSGKIEMHWLEDGDHDLKPRKASGRTHDQNLAEAIAAAVDFAKRL